MAQTITNLGRASRAGIYMEPVLMQVANGYASKKGVSLSSYLRQLLLDDLMKNEQLTQEQLLEIARSG